MLEHPKAGSWEITNVALTIIFGCLALLVGASAVWPSAKILTESIYLFGSSQMRHLIAILLAALTYYATLKFLPGSQILDVSAISSNSNGDEKVEAVVPDVKSEKIVKINPEVVLPELSPPKTSEQVIVVDPLSKALARREFLSKRQKSIQQFLDSTKGSWNYLIRLAKESADSTWMDRRFYWKTWDIRDRAKNIGIAIPEAQPVNADGLTNDLVGISLVRQETLIFEYREFVIIRQALTNALAETESELATVNYIVEQYGKAKIVP